MSTNSRAQTDATIANVSLVTGCISTAAGFLIWWLVDDDEGAPTLAAQGFSDGAGLAAGWVL